MRRCLVVLAKTPGLSPVKTRLAEEIGETAALAFYRMCKGCLDQFKGVKAYSIYVATGEKKGVNNSFWNGFSTFHAKGDTLGEKQCFVFDCLLQKYEVVVLIGIDIPQINRALINEAFLKLERAHHVIGTAKDGGFYLLGTRKKIPKTIWNRINWSTAITGKQFVSSLDKKPLELKELTDVDYLSDVKAVVKEMPRNMSLGQQKIVSWIRELT